MSAPSRLRTRRRPLAAIAAVALAALGSAAPVAASLPPAPGPGGASPDSAVVGASTASTIGPASRGGTIEVVDANDTNRVLDGGDWPTVFTLRVPGDAVCPGDSEHDQWRIQSFVVPAADDPGQLRYAEIQPVGDGRWALYDTRGNPYVHILLRPNAAAGSPGHIDTIAELSFGVFPDDVLPPGRYRIGLACTYFRTTAVYWDTEIDIARDAGGVRTWTVVDDPSPAAGSTTPSGGTVGAAAGAAGAGGAGTTAAGDAGAVSGGGGAGHRWVPPLFAVLAVVVVGGLAIGLRRRATSLSKEHA